MSIAKLVVSEGRTANIDAKNIDAATNIQLIKDIFGQTCHGTRKLRKLCPGEKTVSLLF